MLDLESFILSESSILDSVDEFELYINYLEFEPELFRAYKSPIRDEGNPSFSIFTANNNSICEYWWKDSGNGGESGDIFKLIQLLYDLKTRKEVLYLIDSDFSLGFISGHVVTNKRKKIQRIPKKRKKCNIKIKSRSDDVDDLAFWNCIGITKKTRNLFNCNTVELFWLYDSGFPIMPTGLCYAYEVGGFYELYQPNHRFMKFRNNLPTYYIGGFLQLRYTSDTLIITKSRKEIMWFRQHLDMDAVCGKSETTMIPEHLMYFLLSRYKNVICFLDNDEAGIKSMLKYKNKYNIHTTHIPIGYSKDPTDLHENYGENIAIDCVKFCLTSKT